MVNIVRHFVTPRVISKHCLPPFASVGKRPRKTGRSVAKRSATVRNAPILNAPLVLNVVPFRWVFVETVGKQRSTNYVCVWQPMVYVKGFTFSCYKIIPLLSVSHVFFFFFFFEFLSLLNYL